MSDEPDFADESEDLLPELGPDDPGSPRGKRKVIAKQIMAEQAASDFWKSILANAIGRQEIWSYLARCGIHQTTFAVGPNGFPQPESTWFKAGEKSAAESLFIRLSILDREGVRLMQDEHDPRYRVPKFPDKKARE